MDIRSSLDGLKSLLGMDQAGKASQTNAASSAATQAARNTSATSSSAFSSDRATFSSVGSEVSSGASDGDVRMEKVNSVQAALAAGTYNVPASAVASKIVDTMLGQSQ